MGRCTQTQSPPLLTCVYNICDRPRFLLDKIEESRLVFWYRSRHRVRNKCHTSPLVSGPSPPWEGVSVGGVWNNLRFWLIFVFDESLSI